MSTVPEARPAVRERRPEPLARARDLFVAALGLVVGAPIVAVASVLVGLSMGRPIFFRQERIGRGGRPFVLVKIRTMRNPTGDQDSPEYDAPRLTQLGRVLRTTSIDELPTLWNVLRGDMSLVGPRPLPIRYLERYSERQARRHEIRPGVTGWSQVNGRNALSWADKFELDVWYLEHRSGLLDLRILLLTLLRLIKPQGISSDGHATMPEFDNRESPRDPEGRPARTI